jgi:hypothetical protein
MLARTLVTVIAVAIACALPCAAAPAVNPGEWQITAKTEMTGMPMQMPPQTMTFTNCVTPDQPVPTEPKQQGQCKVFDIKTEGQAVSWTIECNGQEGKMKGSGKIVYTGDTMDGEQKMNVSAGEGMNLTIVMHMSGKRLGPCKEKK